MEPLDGLAFEGFVATGCGRTSVLASWQPAGRVRVHVFARWMGDKTALEVTLDCAHHARGSHYGVLLIEGAADASGRPLVLPPSDGPVLLEYVRVPPQEVPDGGSDTMEAAGAWTSPFSLLLWLHRDSFFDDGTQLARDEYDDPPETFAPVVAALAWLKAPWKLGQDERAVSAVPAESPGA